MFEKKKMKKKIFSHFANFDNHFFLPSIYSTLFYFFMLKFFFFFDFPKFLSCWCKLQIYSIDFRAYKPSFSQISTVHFVFFFSLYLHQSYRLINRCFHSVICSLVNYLQSDDNSINKDENDDDEDVYYVDDSTNV